MIRGLLLAVLLAAPAAAPAGDELRNWFGDPFFQVSHDIAACPEPRGPFATRADSLADSHHRAERGTRCHQEGRCRLPSSYDYDREIAAHIEAATARGKLVPHPSTLWVLVQGRRVWVYGCVSPGYRRGVLEKSLRAVPDVELALEQVRIGARGEVPYRLR